MTLCSQCRGPVFNPQLGNWILHTNAKTQLNQINKYKYLKNYQAWHSTPFTPVHSSLPVVTTLSCNHICVIILPASLRACMCVLSHVQLFATLWTIVHQAPLSMDFSRQEYWSGLPFLTPGDLPDPRDGSCVSCILCTGRQFFTTVPPGKSLLACKILQFIFIAQVPRAV